MNAVSVRLTGIKIKTYKKANGYIFYEVRNHELIFDLAIAFIIHRHALLTSGVAIDFVDVFVVDYDIALLCGYALWMANPLLEVEPKLIFKMVF